MILELLSNPLTWIMAFFVIVCAWHNFKVGYKQGVAEGVDVVLEMLNAEKLIDLEGANRITSFIEILNDLATTNDYTLLNANGFAFEAIRQDSNKIEIIYNHINDNFKEHITLDEVSNLVSMTVPAFCRYFKKSTGKTFTKLVNEYRVVHATKLLAESNMSITNISFECGFNNFSHFNKLFKEFTGKSASIYRSEMKDLIQ